MAVSTKGVTRKEQIVSEAIRLFARHGYQGTPVRTIARACGVTEAAIYRHFDNKAAIYDAALREKATAHDVESYLRSIDRSQDIEAVLKRVAEHILGFLDADPELLDLMFNNSVENGPAAAILFKEIRSPYIEFIAREIEQRAEAGEVRDVDPYITARCFVGMVMDCAMSVGAWNKVRHFPFNPADVIRNNVPIFGRGLRRVDTAS